MTTPLLNDPVHADVRVEFGIAWAEVAAGAANRATAEQWAAVADVLDEARQHPEVFLGPLPSPGPGAILDAATRSSFAVRAAVADVAVRLSVGENTVRTQAAHAMALRTRMPRLWEAFREGVIGPANARTAAELALQLPAEPELIARFDEELAEPAHTLAPARFRAKARALREQLCAETLAERTAVARQARGVWLDADVDGMAWLSMHMPAVEAHTAYERIDAAARSLLEVDGEERTLMQLRSDVAADVLTSGSEHGSSRVGVSVAVTVPVMTLLGHGDEPGTLDGYGPIDAATARELAGHAPSFTRILVHPVSSAVLDVDRTTYRVPADLKKWLAIRDRTCVFPGCGASAKRSDLDHTVDWQHGGATRADNLAHLCRHHHRLKHESRWKVRHTSQRILEWTSPTGEVRHSDPPPF